jgi:predicted dehydrogenase
MKLGVGLYGKNGHQIFGQVRENPHAEAAAAVGLPENILEGLLGDFPDMRCYDTLEEMLRDDGVRLVSLCSPVRARQAEEAALCMKAGRHVYAEKPCALSVAELDGLMETAAKHGVRFHEMAGTAFEEPYRTMGETVRSGRLGEVVQVFAQKSYPYFPERPQDEKVDGGMLRQVSVHALRMVERAAGRRILEIAAVETKLGSPYPGGGLHMAASFMMKLEGGALASALANYLNPRGFGPWGNESLRIFGTKGFAEAVDGGARTRLVIGDEDLGPLAIPDVARDYFDLVVDSILGVAPAPLSVEEELHPTRAVLRAKESALRGGVFIKV